ncbi:hypothetical protein [Acidocella sp.]|uniref:hypothetical protein n=1 Tax=Acidocella sp. TaxID=50710 RepID=UPI003D0049D4
MKNIKYGVGKFSSLRFRFVTLFVLCTINAMFAANVANAEELWDQQLRGLFLGAPAGVLPPPGLYGELDNYYTSYSLYGSPTGAAQGYSPGDKVPNTHLTVLVEVPILMWVSPWHFLGASYAAAISQPIVYSSYQLLQHEFEGGGGNLVS